MKNKESTSVITMILDGVMCNMDCATQKYIANLQAQNNRLAGELAAIKPVIEKKMLEPAISNGCRNCKYCITSKWNDDILGCNKNAVCSDFSPKEDE